MLSLKTSTLRQRFSIAAVKLLILKPREFLQVEVLPPKKAFGLLRQKILNTPLRWKWRIWLEQLLTPWRLHLRCSTTWGLLLTEPFHPMFLRLGKTFNSPVTVLMLGASRLITIHCPTLTLQQRMHGTSATRRPPAWNLLSVLTKTLDFTMPPCVFKTKEALGLMSMFFKLTSPTILRQFHWFQWTVFWLKNKFLFLRSNWFSSLHHSLSTMYPLKICPLIGIGAMVLLTAVLVCLKQLMNGAILTELTRLITWRWRFLMAITSESRPLPLS